MLVMAEPDSSRQQVLGMAWNTGWAREIYNQGDVEIAVYYCDSKLKFIYLELQLTYCIFQHRRDDTEYSDGLV